MMYNNKSLAKHLLSAIVWAASGFIMASLAAFAHIAFLSRTLPTAEMGIYFLYFSIAMFMSTISTLGLPDALVRTVAKAFRTDETIYSKTVGFSYIAVTAFAISLATITALTSKYTIFKLFNIPWNQSHAILLCLWFSLLAIQSIQSATFKAKHDLQKAIFFGSTFRNLLYILFSFVIYYSTGRLDLTAALQIVVTSTLVNNIVAFLIKLKPALTENKLRVTSNILNIKNNGPLISLALPLLANTLAILFIARIGLWSLGYAQDKSTVAMYGSAIQLATLMTMPLLVTNSLCMPLIADMFYNSNGDHKSLEKVLRSITSLIALPMIMAYIFILFFGDDVLAIIFGQTFSNAYLALVLLCTGQILNIVVGCCGLVLKMTNHHIVIVKINFIFGLVTLLLSIPAAKTYGPAGVASIFMLTTAFQNILTWRLSISKVGINTGMYLNFRNYLNCINDIKYTLTKKNTLRKQTDIK